MVADHLKLKYFKRIFPVDQQGINKKIGVNKMKVVTIHQPWAWAIVEGYKDIENRTWPTKYRGKLLIHAGNSKQSLKPATEFMKKHNIIVPSNLVYGSIIGEVELVYCVRNSDGIWAIDDHWHWVLRNAIKYDIPIPCKGQLGLFDYIPESKQEQVIEVPKALQLSLF